MKNKSMLSLLMAGFLGLCVSMTLCSCGGGGGGDDKGGGGGGGGKPYEEDEDEVFTAPALRKGDILVFHFTDNTTGEISKMDYTFTITGKKTAVLDGVGEGEYDYQPSATGKTASFYFSSGILDGVTFTTLTMTFNSKTTAKVDVFISDGTSRPSSTSDTLTGGTLTIHCSKVD